MSQTPKKVECLGRRHMAITREYLLRYIDGDPTIWKELVLGAATREEAREFIRTGPPFQPIGECPDFDHETGVCPGHDYQKDVE